MTRLKFLPQVYPNDLVKFDLFQIWDKCEPQVKLKDLNLIAN